MIITFLISAISIILAITIHEFSHALVADHLGDPTPRAHGRLTLNPLKHLDPLGTLALFIFHFGWGKPIPIDPLNLKNPSRGQMLISLAGPASNLITALILSLIIRFAPIANIPLLMVFFYYTITISIVLAVFNLIPLYPLDGSKILLGLLPEEKRESWEQALVQYSTPILLLLIIPFTGHSLIGTIISPIIDFFLRLFLPVGFV